MVHTAHSRRLEKRKPRVKRQPERERREREREKRAVMHAIMRINELWRYLWLYQARSTAPLPTPPVLFIPIIFTRSRTRPTLSHRVKSDRHFAADFSIRPNRGNAEYSDGSESATMLTPIIRSTGRPPIESLVAKYLSDMLNTHREIFLSFSR